MTAVDDTAIDTDRYRMQVTVETEYLPDQSDEDGQRWVFAYHIRILNQGAVTARLLTRHWVITDGEERSRGCTVKAWWASSPASRRDRSSITPAAPSSKPKWAPWKAVTR